MKYKKSDLEAMLLIQLENLMAMEDLVWTMKRQNDLIQQANKALQSEIEKFEKKHYAFLARKNRGNTVSG